MKKILKPATREEFEFSDDFTGELLPNNYPPVTVTIECGYGSRKDGSFFEFHLNDESCEKLLDFIKGHLANRRTIEDCNETIK